MGKEDYDFDDNLFYGFTLKDLLKFAIPAVVGTFTKNIISDFIESITSTTQIIINLSGTVILVAVLLPILMYLIIKRNTRVRVKKEEEKLKKNK